MTEIDDDLWDDDFTDYRFSELVAELERTGEIIKQWENGAPIDNAPTKTKTNENEKRETIQ